MEHFVLGLRETAPDGPGLFPHTLGGNEKGFPHSAG